MMHRLISLNRIRGAALDIWPTYSGYNSWMGNQNFSSVQSFEKYWNEKYIEQKEKIYDALNYLLRIIILQEKNAAGIQISSSMLQ